MSERAHHRPTTPGSHYFEAISSGVDPAELREAADRGMAVLFSSTELEELHDLADVVVTMHKGVVVQRHEGQTAGAVLLREMTHGAAMAEAPR